MGGMYSLFHNKFQEAQKHAKLMSTGCAFVSKAITSTIHEYTSLSKCNQIVQNIP